MKSYPLGAKFGQFVHIGSMVKSLLELSTNEPPESSFESDMPDLNTALSAPIPSVDSSVTDLER